MNAATRATYFNCEQDVNRMIAELRELNEALTEAGLPVDVRARISRARNELLVVQRALLRELHPEIVPASAVQRVGVEVPS